MAQRLEGIGNKLSQFRHWLVGPAGCCSILGNPILFKDVKTIRISDTFEKPEMATDLMEHDLQKLNILRQRGSESFATRELELKEFLL